MCNAYGLARQKAAEINSVFRSAESAGAYMNIQREKLLQIEQADPDKIMTVPTPDEVLLMVEKYDAPELCNYYCTQQCPIGIGGRLLNYNSLGEISASLMSALYFLDGVKDSIHTILADNLVSEEEKQEFLKSLNILKSIAYSAECLELWAKKNGYIE